MHIGFPSVSGEWDALNGLPSHTDAHGGCCHPWHDDPNELSCFLQEGETTSDGSFRMCMDPKLLCNSVNVIPNHSTKSTESWWEDLDLVMEPNVVGKTQPVSFMWNRFWLVYPLTFEPGRGRAVLKTGFRFNVNLLARPIPYIVSYPLVLTNIAMENGPFIDSLPGFTY